MLRMGIELDKKKNETKLKRKSGNIYSGWWERENDGVKEETAKQITKTGKTIM